MGRGYLLRLLFGGHTLGLGYLRCSVVSRTLLSLGLGRTLLLGLECQAAADVRGEGGRSGIARLLSSDSPFFIAALADEKGFGLLPSRSGRINTLGG